MLVLALVVRLIVSSAAREGVHGGVSKMIGGIVPLTLVGIYPLLWYIVIQNHSQEHYILFGFKNTAIVVVRIFLNAHTPD